ncbi:MAG: alpha-E domain-containing protein [Lachnospiraceae bacterium]
MGIVTVEKANELYWLGRYAERVYLTIKEFCVRYDLMIDEAEDLYVTYCETLNIKNVYTSKQDFLQNYPFDSSNEDSIISNLNRAYDNALVLRDEIGTESMGYIQLAIYEINKSAISGAPIIEMQHVIDNLLAFWACADDLIEDQQSRNILKVGKRMERLDLCLRYKFPLQKIQKEFRKLESRLHRTKIHFDEEILLDVINILSEKVIDYDKAIIKLENLIKKL